MTVETQSLLKKAIEIALNAGNEIIKIYATDFEVQKKDDRSPVTEADMVAHRVIEAELSRLTPDWPILSEEAENIPYSTRRQWDTYWLVDPLDGTREFVKKNGEFTVNIALIQNELPILGVIYAPVPGVCYYADKNGGAFKKPDDGPVHAIKTRPFKTGDGMVVLGSRSHDTRIRDTLLKVLGEHRFKRVGSSLKSCMVAEGAADVYPRFGPTSEWDTAAAQSIVEEAGGLLVDTALQPLRYNTKESLLNPHFIVVGDPSCEWSRILKLVPVKD